jgi:YidC/Oxa1 family membrane protein insertase
LLIPVLTGVFQFIQSKMMLPPTDPKKKDDKTKKKSDDFATAFQSQSLYIFPVMIGFLSYNFPIGLSLYWNTFTIFGIIQQYKISGLGGLEDWIKKWKNR